MLVGNSIIVCFKNYSEQNNKNNIKKIKFENISYYKKLVKNYNLEDTIRVLVLVRKFNFGYDVTF